MPAGISFSLKTNCESPVRTARITVLLSGKGFSVSNYSDHASYGNAVSDSDGMWMAVSFFK